MLLSVPVPSYITYIPLDLTETESSDFQVRTTPTLAVIFKWDSVLSMRIPYAEKGRLTLRKKTWGVFITTETMNN